MAEISLSVANFLTYKQSTATNIKWQNIESRLGLTDLADSSMSLQGVVSKLAIRHVATVTKTLHLGTSNVLPFVQSTVPRRFDKLVTTNLVLWHEAAIAKSKLAKNNLVLVDDASCDVARHNTIDAFLPIDVADYTIIKAINVQDTLNLRQGVSVYKESKLFIAIPLD